MAYIGRDIEYGVLEKQTLTADSSTVAFDLTYISNANGLIVSVGGIVQEPNVAYTVLGSTLTFTAAPTTGDTVYVVYLGQEMTVSEVIPTDYMDYQVGTGDGSDTTPITTLNHSVSLAQDIMVTLNGVRQVPSTDYGVSGTTLTFTTAPADGVAILVYFLVLVRADGTVVDNSVTDAKIVGMSGSKITTGTVPAGAVSNASIIGMDAAKLTGSLPESMGADLSLSYQRLATLGLHVQNLNNKVAFNLTDSFLDSFEDSTGVDSANSVNALVSSDEYVTSASELDTATNIAPSSNDWIYTHAQDEWPAAGNALGDHTSGGYVDNIGGDSSIASLNTFDGDFEIEATHTNVGGLTTAVFEIEDDDGFGASDGNTTLRTMSNCWSWQSGTGTSWSGHASGSFVHNNIGEGTPVNATNGSVIKWERVGGQITVYADGVAQRAFTTTSTKPLRYAIVAPGLTAGDIDNISYTDSAKIQRDGMFDDSPLLDASNIGAGASRKYRGTFFKATRTGKVTGLKVYVHNVNTAGTFHAEVWTHDGTSPGSQIGSNSNSINFNSTGEKNFTFTDPTIIKGQTYWMIVVDDGSTGAVEMRDYNPSHPQDMGGGRVNDAATSLTDDGSEYQLRIEVAIDTSAGEPTPDHDTLLLVQSDTTNGSTDFVDSSQFGHTVTTVGGHVQHSTAQALGFGTSSILFDGTGDYLSFPNSYPFNDLDANTNGDFTVDATIRIANLGSTGVILALGNAAAWSTTTFTFGVAGSNKLYGAISNNGSPGLDLLGSTTLSADTDYHVALVKLGSSIKMYLNGVVDYSTTNGLTLKDSTYPLTIGTDARLTTSWFDGWIKEVRFSSVARWDADFTPPTSAYGTATSSTLSATGSLVSTASTADSTVSEVTGALLVKDSVGTTTIGTDLKAYFSADNGSNWTEAASYGSPTTFNTVAASTTGAYETGDRTSTITVTSPTGTITPTDGAPSNLVDGDLVTRCGFHGNSTNSTRYVRFQFASAKVIDEVKFYQAAAISHGVWKWQGSNDGTTFTDIGASFTLGGVATQTITTLSANTTSYLYYQIVGVSGTMNASNFIREFEFKVSTTTPASYTNVIPLGKTTVSNTGTAVKMKAEWANQVATVPASGTTKTISPVGDANFSSSFPRFGNSTMYCDGTGDLISVADSDDFAFAGDYTVEFWSYFVGTPPNNAHCWGQGGNIAGNIAFMCRSEGGGTFIFGTSNGSTERYINPGIDLSDAWHHIAMVKSGTSQKLYIDGTHRGSELTHSEPVQNVSAPWEFGGNSSQSSYIEAYFDEIRFSDSARYTANFTPSTTAFTTDANTKLLIHSDATDDGVTFTDSSSNARTITAVGDAKHSAAKTKFGSSSILFDGTGDEITVPDSTDWYFGGLNAFTIDFWINTTTGARGLMSQNTSDPATNWDMYVATNGQIYFTSVNGPSLLGTTAIHDGAWHHVAIAWSGTNWNLYIDGTSDASATDSSWGADVAATLRIGKAYASGSNNFIGNLDEIRISDIARYTANFTPSTTTYTSDANTLLLIHSDDASQIFTDSSSNTHTVTAVGDAKHKPVVKKIGTSSIVFDGSGDYLTLPKTDDWQWTGDFTIETWFYLNSLDRGSFFSTSIEDSTHAGIGVMFEVADNKVTWQGRTTGTNSQAIQSAVINTGQWYHAAVVRSGTASGNIKVYLDGVALGTTSTQVGTMAHPASVAKIGLSRDDSATTFDGYMDEIRISDSARYTANFTPSTTAFTADANTQLLIHGDSTNPQTQVGQAVGAVFGNMNASNGSNAKAFDGTTNASAPNIAATPGATVNAYIGKDWGTSYVTGDRSSDITVTTNMTTTRPITNIVNGAKSGGNDGFYFTGASGNGQTVDSSKYIRFQLATAKTFIGCRIYNDENDDSAGHGFWKWQGSNDATTWTDLGGSFELKNTLISSVPGYADFNGGLPSNTTEYTYYQMVGVSGLADGNSNWLEWEFGEATGITSKTISGVKIYGSSNEGYCGGAGVSTIKLMGSNTLPSSASDGTELGAFPDIPDSNSTNPQQKMSGFTTTTAYRYHWLWNAYTNNDQAFFAEVEFFEGDSIIDSSYAPEVIGKVAQLHGWAVNY
jgi:hypothetical protein